MARVVKVIWAASKKRWKGKKPPATTTSSYTGGRQSSIGLLSNNFAICAALIAIIVR